MKGLVGSDWPKAAGLMGEMHGLPQKLGQHLTLYPAGGLTPYFEGLCAAGRVEDIKIESVLQDLNIGFTTVQAAAQASIGQVYRVETIDRVLAVKVKYPGLEKRLRNDLRVLRALLWPARFLPLRNSALLPLLGDLETLILKECDYIAEADNQEKFANLMAQDAEIRVPPVLFRSDRAIASHWVDGQSLANYRELDAEWFVQTYFRFILQSLKHLGKFHADPHPGNFLITDSRELCVLDFGSVAAFESDERSAVVRLLLGAYTYEKELIADLAALGVSEEIMGVYAPIAGDLVAILLEPIYARGDYDFANWRLQYKVNTLMGSRDWGRPFQLPTKLLLLVRTLQGLYYYARRNRVKLNWHNLVQDHLG